VVANPELLPEDSTPPPVLLTRVATDGQTIASYGGAVSSQMAANLETINAPLQLPPSYRHLEFDFTAFHFTAPENIRFRYQLTGFDNGWIDADTERYADYSRLAAGKYEFCVEASIGEGPWSTTPSTLLLTVEPFFWQTWWFRLSALMLFTSSVIAIVRYISLSRIRAKMHLLEQRAALDRERTRIARDLHDDLGCSLNKVALTMEAMQRNPAGSEPEKIRQCWTMVREVAGSVDEIVWAINPRNDTLRYMVDYLCHFAFEFLQVADIPCLIGTAGSPSEPGNFPRSAPQLAARGQRSVKQRSPPCRRERSPSVRRRWRKPADYCRRRQRTRFRIFAGQCVVRRLA
jgi:hypothetical protein